MCALMVIALRVCLVVGELGARLLMFCMTWPRRFLEVLFIGSDVDVGVLGFDTRALAMLSKGATRATVLLMWTRTLASMYIMWTVGFCSEGLVVDVDADVEVENKSKEKSTMLGTRLCLRILLRTCRTQTPARARAQERARTRARLWLR